MVDLPAIQETRKEEAIPVDLWDEKNPRSMLSVLPDEKIKDKIIAAQKARPELFLLDERALARELRKARRTPGPTDNRLRLNFWHEYERIHSDLQGRAPVFKSSRIYAGVCTSQYFHDKYMNLPDRVAWLLCPPASYNTVLEEGLSFGMERMRTILGHDPFRKDGTIDIKTAELQMKIVKMMDDRAKGGVLQRTQNLQVNVTGKQVDSMLRNQSMEQLEKRMKQLEKQDRMNPKNHGAIDVIPTTVKEED